MTRDELARIALRYDTALSRAMLRALGVDPPARRKGGGVSTRGVDRYGGVLECMAQRHGVRQ